MRQNPISRVFSVGLNQDGISAIEIEQTIADVSINGMAAHIADRISCAPRLDADRRYVQQVEGPALEDFQVGDVYDHGRGRTVLADEGVWIALLSMNRDPVFFDRNFARKAGLTDLLIDSCFILSTVLGLSVKYTTERAVANLGWRDVRWYYPVHPGDTIYAETEILDVRPSASRAGQGIVGVRTVGLNQRGEVVLTYERSFLTYSRINPARDRVMARPVRG